MTRPRVLLTRRWPEAVEARLAARYDLTVDPGDRPLSAEELRTAMGAFDALCPTVSDRIDATILTAPHPRVRIVGNFGVGTDNIDLAAAQRAGIAVSNTPGVLTEATADIALLLLLMVARRSGEGEREVRAGRWSGWRPTHLLGRELRGQNLGLVGFGRIAQAVARRARHGFGMNIHCWTRSDPDPSIMAELGATRHARLDTLLPGCAAISLHVPGGVATHHLIDRTRLALLQPGAILINTARGSVIDETALAEALAAGRIAGAGLDVYEREPEIHPLLMGLENVVLLPHLGSATIETRSAMGHKVADNLDAFFAGQPLPDPVVPPPSA